MREDGFPELLDAILARRHRGDDGRLPPPSGRQVEHRPQLRDHAQVAVDVGFVDDEDVRDLEDAGLDHLHAVAEVWGQDDDCGVGDRRDLELRLTDTDRLDRKSTRLNSSHLVISYAVFCLKKKKHTHAVSSSGHDCSHTHNARLLGSDITHTLVRTQVGVRCCVVTITPTTRPPPPTSSRYV